MQRGNNVRRHGQRSQQKMRSRYRFNGHSVAILICLLASGIAKTNADCEKDGKTYLNGDKLVDPETPCTVCYCQGGEILCSSVTCFHRDDCNPKYIAGRCCPIYNNCPVTIFDPNHNVGKIPPPVPATEKPSPAPQLINPKITIKEITRPIEIRITDDNKAIPIHQMLKPTTSTSTTTTPAPSSTTAAAFASTNAKGEVQPNNCGESKTLATPPSISADTNRQTLFPVGGINTVLKLSASVAYPTSERAPAATTTKTTAAQHSTVAKSESSAETDSSEEQVTAKYTNGEVLPLFDAQGLHRVDADSPSDPEKVNIKRENLATTERAQLYNAATIDDFNSAELIYAQSSTVQGDQNIGLQSSPIDLEPDTAGSNNIYHIILTTTGPLIESSSVSYSTPQSVSTTEDYKAEATPPQPLILLPMPSSSPSPTSKPSKLLSSSPSTAIPQQTTDGPTTNSSPTPALPLGTSTTPQSVSTSDASSSVDASSTTESLKSSTDGVPHMEEEETAIQIEANPAYPSLPEDDFSLRDVNFPLSETDDAVESEVKDEQRSIAHALDILNSTNQWQEGSGAGVMLISDVLSSTLAGGSSTTENTPNLPERVALLINSAEDLSAETAISNSTDFQLDRLTANKSSSEESLEAQLSIESGSGSGELFTETKKEKRREPTTARPMQNLQLDIDELGNGSGDGKSDPVEDPKLDAESIKADENVEEGIIKQEVGHKEDVLTVNTNAAQERTVEEVVMPLINDGVNGRVQRLVMEQFDLV